MAIGWLMLTAARVMPLLYQILWEGFPLDRTERVTKAMIRISNLETTGLAFGLLSGSLGLTDTGPEVALLRPR